MKSRWDSGQANYCLLAAILLPAHLTLMGIDACSDLDSDGDGWTVEAGDCDDSDPDTHPGAGELCDGLDNDCNGQAEDPEAPFYIDQDGDGFGGQASDDCDGTALYVQVRGDCDDHDASVFPGAADAAGDEIDQDCGGSDGAQPSVGLSSSAYAQIADALAAATDGDVVWVGPGTYREHDIDFGGHAATLISTSFSSATVINAQSLGRVLSFQQGEGPQSVLDGFTLTGGFDPKAGAGVYMSGSSPTLRRCAISGNVIDGTLSDSSHAAGAGVYLEASSPTLEDCTISDNSATAYIRDGEGQDLEEPISYGGGVYMSSSAPTFTGCVFSGNMINGISQVDGKPAYNYGGGVSITSSVAEFRDCTWSDNWAGHTSGQAGEIDYGGALYVSQSTARLEGCTLSGNAAWQGKGPVQGDYQGGQGGAIRGGDEGNLELNNCVLTDNYAQIGGAISSTGTPTLTHCRISANTASLYGGGIALRDTGGTIEHCILTGNSAYAGVAGISLTNAQTVIDHCVITGNAGSDEGGITGEGEVVQSGITVNQGSSPTITNSILAHNYGYNLYISDMVSADPTVLYCDLYNPEGDLNYNLSSLDASNLTLEPGFLSYDADGSPINLHLSIESPLVNAGTPGAAAVDVDGSNADLGGYGGPGGDGWDLDRDGWNDYFWPGALNDAPAGYSPTSYDSNDGDPDVH